MSLCHFETPPFHKLLFFSVCRELVLGILTYRARWAGCGSQATTVLLFEGTSWASVSRFCCQASLLGSVVRKTYFLESSLPYGSPLVFLFAVPSGG